MLYVEALRQIRMMRGSCLNPPLHRNLQLYQKIPQPLQWFATCLSRVAIHLILEQCSCCGLQRRGEERKGALQEAAACWKAEWTSAGKLKQRLVWAKERFMGKGKATLSCDAWVLPRNAFSWITTWVEKEGEKRDKEYERIVSVRKGGFGMWPAGLQNCSIWTESPHIDQITSENLTFIVCWCWGRKVSISHVSPQPRLAIRKKKMQKNPAFFKFTVHIGGKILYLVTALSCSA